MKIVRKPVKSSTIGQLFASLPQPKNGPCLTRLRGNARADLVLLADHPAEEDYENNVPLVGAAGSMFLEILSQTGWDVEQDFLIVPCSRFGEKANTASTRDTPTFLELVQETLPKKIIVCAGMGAFAPVFAGGRKTHFSSIIGNPMWIPRFRSYVYVLPGYAGLADPPANFKEQKIKEKRVLEIAEQAQALMKFATSKGAKI